MGGWFVRASAAALLLLLIALWAVPFPAPLLDRFPASTLLLDRAGEPLRVQLGEGGLDCRPGYEPRADDWIARALIAAEDERFWLHPGVDPLAVARAVGQNLGAGRRVSGASTLSTQVMRMLQPRRRTWIGKAVEAFRALQLERRLSKDEILAQYLNRAPFGGNLTGIEAASRRYFAKGAHDLSLAEAALLAGLPQSPSRLRPDRHPARARARQRYVLDRMVACGFINEPQRREALALRVAVRREEYPMRAPHFAEALLNPGLKERGAGGVLRTTLDPEWQRRAESALRRQVSALREQGVQGGAVVVVDVRRGAVCALAGSPDYFAPDAGQVNGALAPRSAGSTLKPFVYALALDGGLITPGAVLADVPRTFSDYQPANFDGTYLGLVRAREALVLSLNLPLLALTEQLGVSRVLGALRACGLQTLDRPAAHYGLGLALGNAEVRLLDLANAYAALARGGVFQAARFAESDAAVPGPRVCSPEAAWLVAEALGGEERAMEATGHRADVRLPRLAWKTGTSSGLRDAWTVAFNPDYVVGVWMGNPAGRAAPALIGVQAAAPVAWEILRARYPDGDGPWFPRPAGVQQRAVCSVSGCPPGPHCAQVEEDWHIAGLSSFRPCEVHRDATGERWPPEVVAYLSRPPAGPAPAPSELKILSPASGSEYRLLDDPAGRAQTVALRAAGGERVYWFVNDACLGQTGPGEALAWPLARGAHRIVCSVASGRSAVSRILVN